MPGPKSGILKLQREFFINKCHTNLPRVRDHHGQPDGILPRRSCKYHSGTGGRRRSCPPPRAARMVRRHYRQVAFGMNHVWNDAFAPCPQAPKIGQSRPLPAPPWPASSAPCPSPPSKGDQTTPGHVAKVIFTLIQDNS